MFALPHRKPPVWLALLLAALAFLLPVEPILVQVQAAVSVVQSCTSFGNDASCTFSAAPSSSNRVLVVANTIEAQTLDITGFPATPATEAVLTGPDDSPGTNSRFYAFCFDAGDDSDTAFVVTTSTTGDAWAAGIELSGANACASILSDEERNDTGSGTSHALTTDLTLAAAGDLALGFIFCSSVADLTPVMGFTSIPAANAEIDGDAQVGYKVAAGAGSEDPAFTSAANETCWLNGLALSATAAAGGRPQDLLLLGVGR